MSATSKWGLGREAQAASLLLRVWTRAECPTQTVGLPKVKYIWIYIYSKVKYIYITFPVKGYNAALWSLVSSQNKRLSEYQRRASWLQIDPCSPEAERQACKSQSWKVKGCYNLGPRDCIFYQTVSRLSVVNHVFLGSWTIGICQECHSLRSASLRRHMARVRWCSHHSQETKKLGLGRWLRCTAHLEECACRAPSCLSCLDLGRAQNA